MNKMRGDTVMIKKTRKEIQSRELALKLYDAWVRERQRRPGLEIPKDKAGLRELGLKNFVRQLAEPRLRHLKQLKEVAPEMTTADKVALLVMLELPALEISTLLHKLSTQLMQDPDAIYFSKVNQADNCGCGCGCGCAFMLDLPWAERINAHMDDKPFSIDPFNEVGLPEKERDSLLIKDFLSGYEALSDSISERVNNRYYQLGNIFRS